MELMTTTFVFSIAVAVVSFLVAAYFYVWVKKCPSSNKKIEAIGKLIAKGAKTFLRREYTVLARFVAIAAVLIVVFLPRPIWLGNAAENIKMAIAYICGAVISALAGVIGIATATKANVKSAEAAVKDIRHSFLSGFRGGAVMGMAVVGASLLGVTLVYMLTKDSSAVLGFSFGASSLALFAKAGGGIFTKTADVSADLVGKVELGIPEDDPRNPAVIADNVGDNVGDVAGMGADLFDSNVASMAAALVMALSIMQKTDSNTFIILVFMYAAIGLLSSAIGVLAARMGKSASPTRALNFSTYVTTAIFFVLTALATWLFKLEWRVWGATTAGLVVGVIIGLASDYFTDDTRRPVQNTANASKSGPAFTILSGVSYGFLSVLPALIGIGLSALVAYKLCAPLGGTENGVLFGMYGISMAAVGMLSIVGMIISNDAYGPIVDNARGLVEMGNLGDKALEVTDSLDSAGNTVKAVTKGFAIGAAGLTIIALLGAFMSEVNEAAEELGLAVINSFDIMNPVVFFGLLVGAAIPAVFSAMLILGVDRNAQRMVAEIHRQFKEILGLKEGKEGVHPEYDKCIDIATVGALKELIPAGVLAILATLVVGFVGGVQAIGGYLTGNIVSGLLLALFMSNSGGLWDNSKKYVESGHCGGKGSDTHKAAVVGDTVGDPFKDTAGPSINTQVTVVSLVSSLMATLFLQFHLFG
ncbi:MAG TPA: sodium-translocating pyrophosphatase [Clostridia bacterium]|nr:sodium-translocating pyrophosphatase [Clostridia bacterium]